MSKWIPLVPSGAWFFVSGVLVFIGLVALICYALRSKGDVTAELSHGSTVFKLVAKERTRRR